MSNTQTGTTTLTPDVPISCTTTLPAFTEVRRGEITSEIEVSAQYYLDPRNNEGSLQERREKLRLAVQDVFIKFIDKREAEYKSVRCRYQGVDWNHHDTTTKTLICQPGFMFLPNTLIKNATSPGDWKGGPDYGPNNTTMSWKTGGHHRSETRPEIDAVYFQVYEKVIDELNQARKILSDKGIPTELPPRRDKDSDAAIHGL